MSVVSMPQLFWEQLEPPNHSHKPYGNGHSHKAYLNSLLWQIMTFAALAKKY